MARASKGPTFSRAKRFTHKHTDHYSIFQGSETQHVKSNMAASVEGNLSQTVTGNLTQTVTGNMDISAAELDLNRTKILRPKNVLRTEKISVTTADLTKGIIASPETIAIYRASPGDTIVDQVANLSAAFSNGTTYKKANFKVGDAADDDGFGVTQKLGTPVGWQWTGNSQTYKGAYLYASLAHKNFKTYTAATMINLTVTASAGGNGATLSAMTAGQIDIYLDIMSRG